MSTDYTTGTPWLDLSCNGGGGADPDFVLPTPEQYYDRAALTDYINSICWKTKP